VELRVFFLLAVLPEGEASSCNSKVHELQRLTFSGDTRQLGETCRSEEQGALQTLWILLVQANFMELIQSMTSALAVRTDLSDVYDTNGQKIGEGGFAEVYVAYPSIKQPSQGWDTDNQRSPKVVAKMFLPGRSGQAERAKKEAMVLTACGSHPNVVSFHGIFRSDFDTGKVWTLLLGHCAGGNLLARLDVHGSFETALAKQFATSMLNALTHIHSMGFMHRDIKPENVLLTLTRRFVLADFGAAVHIPEGQSSLQCVGTPGYLAPEVLKRKSYNELVDLFSLGATMYFCICRKQLFSGRSRPEMLRSNAECKIDFSLYASRCLSTAGLEFLKKLLSKESSKRPSAKDALCHIWFKEGDEVCTPMASESSEASKRDACEDVDGSSSHHDNGFDGWFDDSHDDGHTSLPGSDPKSHKRSIPSFRGLLPRLRLRRVRRFTKIHPAVTQDDASHVDNLVAAGNHSWKVRGAQRRFASRASKVVAWVRGGRTISD